jgi:hypothetical protein
MRSRINNTGRKKIQRDRIAIVPREDGGFECDLDVANLGLPPTGRIVVEAHRQSITERFDFGTVAEPGPKAIPVLRQLDLEDVTFRVKVVDPQNGRLLARADRLQPNGHDEGGRRELLTVRIKDIGPEPWKVEIDPAGEPVLILNDAIPGADARITTDPLFQALILPAAFRQVLHLLWAENEQLEQDDDSPASRWLAFSQALTGQEPPDWEDDNAVVEWIDAACREFAARHPFMSVFKDGGNGGN